VSICCRAGINPFFSNRSSGTVPNGPPAACKNTAKLSHPLTKFPSAHLLPKIQLCFPHSFYLYFSEVRSSSNKFAVYYHQEKYAEVLADLSAAIKLDPKNGEPYALRGEIYAQLECVPKALKDFEMALSLNPNDILSYANHKLLSSV